jgi:G3E family GTPase
VGIDHHLVRKTDARTTLLRDGCVCCSLRDDLVEALRGLLSQRHRRQIPRFQRVVIETTGLADPAPILQTVNADPVLRSHYRVARVIATVDVPGGGANLDAYGEAMRQVAAADLLVVTKPDLATPEAAAALRSRLHAINPTATIVDAAFGRIDFGALLAEGLDRDEGVTLLANAPTSSGPAPVHEAADRVSSRCFVFAEPLNWQMFGIWLTMLLHRHGDRILRMKGLLNVGEDMGPLLLEGVQHVVHAPRHLREWPDADRRSRIVFIAHDLDLSRVQDSLRVFQDVASAV